jgi:hypothetical protein
LNYYSCCTDYILKERINYSLTYYLFTTVDIIPSIQWLYLVMCSGCFALNRCVFCVSPEYLPSKTSVLRISRGVGGLGYMCSQVVVRPQSLGPMVVLNTHVYMLLTLLGYQQHPRVGYDILRTSSTNHLHTTAYTCDTHAAMRSHRVTISPKCAQLHVKVRTG